MKALVGPNELAPTGFPRGEDARRLVAHTCALSQLFARAQLCRADRRQDLERLGAAASAGIRIAAKLMAVGSRLGSAARPLPSSPWSLDVAPPDAVGLPTLGLASPRRACLVPSLSVRPPESRPQWESAVELRPRDARPWARHGANFRVRHMSDRESADALSRRLVVERGRIRCAWGGNLSAECFEFAVGRPGVRYAESIRAASCRHLSCGRGGGKCGLCVTCVLDYGKVGT